MRSFLPKNGVNRESGGDKALCCQGAGGALRTMVPQPPELNVAFVNRARLQKISDDGSEIQ